MTQRDDMIALIVSKAKEHGIVPWELLGGAIAESSLNPTAWRQGDWPDWSAGLFQQTVMFADEGDHTPSPENVALIKRLYFDAAHACDVAAAKFKYWRTDPDVPALTAWCAYNMPASYQDPESNPNIENYRAGLAEARSILGVAMPAPTYDPTTPITPQNHDWDCSEQSTLWGMTAFGRRPSDGWMEAQMIADGVVSTRAGLLDGSGGALADWITVQYGPANNDPTLNYHAYNVSAVTFSDVVTVAGLSPVLIGGHNWGPAGHWVGVRRYSQANDWLELANPADGYAGIHQTMTRAQWETIAPVSMVVIGWGEPAPVPAPDQSATIAALTAQVAALTAENAALISKIGYATGDLAGAFQAAVNTLRGLAS